MNVEDIVNSILEKCSYDFMMFSSVSYAVILLVMAILFGAAAVVSFLEEKEE